jgi:formate hydrogenlyase subunit 3/multisubunit Na+/H+ antiporter MnhD subunit
MKMLPLAILGALIGGGYEAYQSFDLMRMGAYSLTEGIGFILAGAAVGAALFAIAAVAYRMVRRG